MGVTGENTGQWNVIGANDAQDIRAVHYLQLIGLSLQHVSYLVSTHDLYVKAQELVQSCGRAIGFQNLSQSGIQGVAKVKNIFVRSRLRCGQCQRVSDAVIKFQLNFQVFIETTVKATGKHVADHDRAAALKCTREADRLPTLNRGGAYLGALGGKGDAIALAANGDDPGQVHRITIGQATQLHGCLNIGDQV